MSVHFIKLAFAVALAALSFGAFAQSPPPYGEPIGVEAARKAAAAAIAESKKNNWGMAVAVVDSGGHQVYFERMDGTQYGSVAVALDKAKASAAYRRPTKAFEDVLAAGGAGLRILTLSGAVAVEGGLPIVVNGKIVGAIGLSGATAQQDGVAAKAGVDALR